MKASLFAIVLSFLQIATTAIHAAPVPLGTAFNYQGVLNSLGARATGNYDFQFALFDAPTNGNQIGPTVTNFNVPVNAGIFSTMVDFGPGNFVGTAEWLAVGVRPTGTTNIFVALAPLQPLTATPNALFARNNAQDTNALVSQGLLSSTITSFSNSLGSMAFQSTNGSTFYTGNNYGPFSLFQSGFGSNDEHVFWFGGADIWYNFNHSVEPEWQFSTLGSVSWTIGEDGQGRAVNHFGGSGTYHSVFYMQYDDAFQTNLPGHSTPFGYALHLNDGTNQNYTFGYWMAEQDPDLKQTYRLNWHDYGGAPPGFHQTTFFSTDHIAGGLGSNTIFWGGAELTNALVRGNVTLPPAAIQFVDFSYSSSDFVVLNASVNLTLVTTNLSYTNKTLNKDIVIHNIAPLAPLALALPTNWTTLSSAPVQANVVPNSIPAGNDLDIHLLVNCGTTTNIYATYSYGWNPTAADSNAQTFFNALGGGLSATESNSVNSFVLAAKTHGYWGSLLAFYPFVGAASNSCSWNLVNPGIYRIAWHGSSSTNFTAKGIYGDGVAFYGDVTGLTPATALASYTDSSVGAWIRGPAIPSPGYFYGVTGANSARWGVLNAGPPNNYFEDVGLNAPNAAGSGLVITVIASFTGFTGQNLKNASVEQRYLNGAPIGGTGINATALPTGNNVYILARNSSPADSFSNANLTGFYVAQNMTDQNVSDLISDWAALNNNLGR